MREGVSCLLVGYLALSISLSNCGGSDSGGSDSGGSSPTSSSETSADSTGIQVLADLNAALVPAFPLLLTGGGVIDGQEGTLTVEGTNIVLSGYSPDGELFLDGELRVNLFVSPWTLKGAVATSGSSEAQWEVDMTIDVSTDPPTYGGTVSDGETVFDLADLPSDS